MFGMRLDVSHVSGLFTDSGGFSGPAAKLRWALRILLVSRQGG